MKSTIVNDRPPVRAFSQATLAALRDEAGLLPNAPLSKADILADAAVDAEAIFSSWGMPEFTAEEIATHLPRLRAIFYAAGTVQFFARPFLQRGIRVFSAWRENAIPVAETTVSEILLANKGFFLASRRYTSAEIRRATWEYFQTLPGNFDCRVGLIGCGCIGSLVAERLRPYRIEVLVFDPFLPDERAATLGVRKASLEEIFSTCQTISNHLANNPQTVGMLDYALFSRMLPNATFINTGRGAQVVEADMARALAEAPDRCAVLDVTEPEPPDPDSPLWTLPNVILSPHLAGSCLTEAQRMGEAMLEEFRAWRDNPSAPSKREVTLPMLATMA